MHNQAWEATGHHFCEQVEENNLRAKSSSTCREGKYDQTAFHSHPQSSRNESKGYHVYSHSPPPPPPLSVSSSPSQSQNQQLAITPHPYPSPSAGTQNWAQAPGNHTTGPSTHRSFVYN